MEVLTQRQAIPLHENEGIYVRNIKTGQVISLMFTFISKKLQWLIADTEWALDNNFFINVIFTRFIRVNVSDSSN